MKPISLSLRGAIGVWRGLRQDEITIDFTKFEKGLIAFVGDNGTGKSTTIENLHPYLTLASKGGALSNHFRLRDSHRDYTFEFNGKIYRTHILIDAHTGKTEAYLYEDGKPLNDGKVPTYKEIVEQRFGTEDLFFRSVFSAQKRESIVDATAGKRKELFYELLELSRYERYAKYAQTKANEIEREIEQTNGKIQQIDTELSGQGDTEAKLGDVKTELDSYTLDVETETLLLKRAQGELTEAQTGIQTETQRQEKLNECKSKIAELNGEIEVQRGNYKTDLDKLDAEKKTITAAIEREQKVANNAGLITTKVAEINRLEGDDATLTLKKGQVEEIRSRKYSHDIEYERATSEYNKQVTMLRNGANVARVTVETEYTQATTKLNADRKSVKERLASVQQQIADYTTQANLVQEVPCNGMERLPDQCQLLATANVAKTKLTLLGLQESKLLTEQEELSGTSVKKPDLDAINRECEDKIKLMPIPHNGLADKFEIEIQTVGYSPEEYRRVRDSLTKLKAEGWKALEQEAKIAESVIREKNALLQKTNELIDLSKMDENTAIEGLELSIAKLEQQKTEIELTLQMEVWVNKRDVAHIAISNAESKIDSNRRRSEDARIRIATLQATTDRVATLKIDQAKYRTESAEKAVKLESWRLVERACGKEGIPALEIDASGGEVSRIANELLAKSFGSKFQIQFDTTRMTKDKKKQTETFAIKVFSQDDDESFEQAVETLSIGEKVWVEKAIQDAVSIYMGKKSTKQFETTFNDEGDGALSPEKKQAFLEMARESFSSGDRYYGVIITHSPEIWQQVSQRLMFDRKSGQIEMIR